MFQRILKTSQYLRNKLCMCVYVVCSMYVVSVRARTYYGMYTYLKIRNKKIQIGEIKN